MIFPALGGVESAAQDRQDHQAHEETLRACMAEAGFDYLTLPYAGSSVALATEAAMDHDAFVTQYGYGLVTLLEAEDARSVRISLDAPDPNMALRAALTDDERARYDETRYGPGTIPGESGPTPADPTAGCQGLANRVYAPAALPQEAAQELQDLEAAITADERSLAAEAAWSDCMKAKGYIFATAADARFAVVILADALTRDAATASRQITAADGSTFVAEVPLYDPQALTAAVSQEKLIARADQDCRDSTGYDTAVRAVIDGHRRQFVHRWLDRIDIAARP